MILRLSHFLLLVPLFVFPSPVAAAPPLQLAVATSLGDALQEIVEAWQQHAGGGEVLTRLGASGTLARQLAEGAPGDIFFSANESWMNWLVGQGIVDSPEVQILAGNALVLVGRDRELMSKLDDLRGFPRIALGSPETVPAGQYAEEALGRAGLRDELAARLIRTRDVRQALTLAELGEVDVAFVYRSDARLAQKARILLQLPPELHAPIGYLLAVSRRGQKHPSSGDFLRFLNGTRATEILRRHGFLVP